MNEILNDMEKKKKKKKKKKIIEIIIIKNKIVFWLKSFF